MSTPDMRATDLTLGRRAQSVEEQLSRYWTWGQAQRTVSDPNDSVEEDLRTCFHRKVLADGTVIDWLLADGPVRRHFDDVLIERRREDRTFTSLENLVDHLGGIRETRSVVVLLSNGWSLVPERRELVDEPFKAPPDARFAQIRTLAGRPGPGDALARQPRQTGFSSSTNGASREIQGCYLELQRLAQLDHARRFRDLVVRAARNNVSMFPVAMNGLAATDAGAAERVIASGSTDQGTVLSRDLTRMTNRVQALRTIAENTGGTAIVNANDIGERMAGLAEELSSYYLISYAPANAARDGRYRRIEVRTRTPDLSIHARPGYVAREVLASGSVRPTAPDPATVAVEDALGALGRARPSSELYVSASVGGLDIVAVVELGTGASGGAAVSVDATADDGARLPAATATIAPGARSALVRLPVGSSRGPWRVTARVTGGRPMQDAIDVAARPASLLGEPLVYRATPSPRSPLHAVASLLFRRTERLRVEWPVVDAPETVTARLLDRQGRGLAVELEAVSDAGADRAVVRTDLVLGPLTDGDYLIELRATRGPVVERRLQAFRVVR